MFRHNWEPATGTVVAVKHEGHPQRISETYTDVKYLVDVKPDSGAPIFRCVVELPVLMPSFAFPIEGSIRRVEADVKRQEARWDRHDPSNQKSGVEAQGNAEFDALRDQAPETRVEPDASNADFLGGFSEN